MKSYLSNVLLTIYFYAHTLQCDASFHADKPESYSKKMIDSEEFCRILKSKNLENVFIFDIRPRKQYDQSHIVHSTSLSLDAKNKHRLFKDASIPIQIFIHDKRKFKSTQLVILYDDNEVAEGSNSDLINFQKTFSDLNIECKIYRNGFQVFFKKYTDLCTASESPFDFDLNSEMTLVKSHLYLGSFENSWDLEQLKNKNIKYILNVSKDLPFIMDALFVKKRIAVEDDSNEMLIHFQDAFSFIDSALEKNENILVHCYAGMSRSTTLVAAYLIHKFKWTTKQSLEFLSEKRPIAKPNEYFLKQLDSYETELRKQNIEF